MCFNVLNPILKVTQLNYVTYEESPPFFPIMNFLPSSISLLYQKRWKMQSIISSLFMINHISNIFSLRLQYCLFSHTLHRWHSILNDHLVTPFSTFLHCARIQGNWNYARHSKYKNVKGLNNDIVFLSLQFLSHTNCN